MGHPLRTTITDDSEEIALRTVSELRHGTQRQTRMHASLRSYADATRLAQESERKRISRDLHDDAIQSLCLLSLELDAEIGKLPCNPNGRLERIKKEIDATLDSLRRLCHELRPEILDELGMVPAIKWLAKEMSERDRIRAKVAILGKVRRFPPGVEVVLFRIAQEALANIRKHSGATKVDVEMHFIDHGVKLKVADNGQGFPVPEDLTDLACRGHLGLFSMLERARLSGGTLEIKSHPGKGSVVCAEIKAG